MHVEVCSPYAAEVRPSIAPLRRRDDLARLDLIDRYSCLGELASGDAVASLMRPYWRQPISMLARWILERKVISLRWRGELLLPMFQFERPRMTPGRAIACCSREFGDLVDDEGFAAWFVHPCEWLNERMPVDVLSADPDAVVDAAHRTRNAFRMLREGH